MEIFERPRGYKGPNLDPTGISFQPRAFANGVYALLARPWPRDNSGVIAGENATLVIDAGINGRVARRIQEIAGKLSDKPVRTLSIRTTMGTTPLATTRSPTPSRSSHIAKPPTV